MRPCSSAKGAKQVPDVFWCDGEVDCPDGQDEQDCDSSGSSDAGSPIDAGGGGGGGQGGGGQGGSGGSGLYCADLTGRARPTGQGDEPKPVMITEAQR